MGSCNRHGKHPFGKKFNSNNVNLIQASNQPFGEDSWKNIAEFGLSSGNGNAARSVVTQSTSGSTGTLRTMASGRQIEPSMNGMANGRQTGNGRGRGSIAAMVLGGGTANLTADTDNNWRAAAPSKEVVDEFDPVQSLGAGALQSSKEIVPDWRLSDATSKCTVSLEEKKKYQKLVNKDTGFTHNGKRRRHFLQGQHSKKSGFGGTHYDKQRVVMPQWNQDNGFAQRMYQQSAMQRQPSTKPSFFGYQDNLNVTKKNSNINRLGNGIVQPGRKPRYGNSPRQLKINHHGPEGTDQSWYDIAEVVQASRIDKICQNMRLISGLLLNNNDYNALKVFSFIMSQKITILKRHLYEKVESENLFNEIMDYLQDYQNGI